MFASMALGPAPPALISARQWLSVLRSGGSKKTRFAPDGRHRRSDKILHTEGPLQTQKGRYSLCRIVQAGPLCGHHTCGDRPVRIISTGINAWRRQFDTANDNDISEDDTVLCPILHFKQYTDRLRTQRQRTQAFDGSNARRKSFQHNP